jgi:predicted ATP-grasp superfamily ATP-dependent carboligase
MMRHTRRLIVGSAGGTNAFGTIESVRECYGDRIFVVAIDTGRRELTAASVLADAFVQVPLARAPEFPGALRDLATAYPDSCYLPLHDEEIEVAARLAAEGGLPPGLELIAPPFDVVRLCNDKWEMHKWLKAKGLPSPETTLATPAALATMRQPAILKPRRGTGGAGVRSINDAAELKDIDSSQWLLQEPLEPPDVSINMFLSRSSRAFRCVCRECFEKRGSVETKMRIYDDPSLASLAKRLARELPLFGASNFELLRDGAGRWQIIDINPRVGASARMIAAVGLDFAVANLLDFWDEPIDALLPPLEGEHYVVRQFANFVTTP